MKGYHYHVDLKSHDPGRRLPSHLEIIRHEWEGPRHLCLRILAYVVVFQEGMEINGKPLNEDAPYQPSFGLWDITGDVIVWGECLPEDFKRIKKITTKSPRSQLVIAGDSDAWAERVAIAIKRQKVRPGKCRILHFEAAMLTEMESVLDRRNEITWAQCDDETGEFQLVFNHLWLESSYGMRCD